MKLERSFYLRPTLEVAPELLGKFFVFHSPHGVLTGEINEVEAYLGELDPASHAYRGKTDRTAVMFGEGGFTYVYFIYGVHYCINVVTEEEGKAAAVLIRSLIPREGIEVMKVNRGVTKENHSAKEMQHLTNGPGKLCQAFGITRQQNGINLVTSEQMYIEDRGVRIAPEQMQCTPRIGITQAKDKLWRFCYPAHLAHSPNSVK